MSLPHRLVPLLVLLGTAGGCDSGAPAPAPTGVVRFDVTAEPGLDPRAILVAVIPKTKGTHHQSRTERVELAEGRGSLTLEVGEYELWVGCRRSPDSVSIPFVPDIVRVEVRADKTPGLRYWMKTGGVVRLPAALGLPPASAGRLKVRCSQGPTLLERWTVLRPNDASDDLVWPPLPPGEWNLVVELADGSEVELGATVAVADPRGAAARRR